MVLGLRLGDTMRRLDHFFLTDRASKRRANREIALVCAGLAFLCVCLAGLVVGP